MLAADGTLTASLADTDLSGFYEARLTRTDGAAETRRYALNVDAAEGDLTALGAEQLAARLEGVKYQYEQAAAFQSAVGELAGYNLGEAIALRTRLAVGGRADSRLVGQLSSGAAPRPGARRRRMTHASLPLLADGVTRTTFEWGRIQSNADWILPIAACIVILLFVRYLYRRDAVELHPLLGWLLTALRTATFFGLLILFLQPHWRSEREVVRNSRVLLLVDTSLSMGLTDGESSSSAGPVSRAQQVVAALAETDFLARLRKVHDVAVFPFSEDLKADRAVSLAKQHDARRSDEPTRSSRSPARETAD